MTRRQFKLLFSVLVGVAALPFAIYVVYERPFNERAYWLGFLAAACLLLNVAVYRPIARRLKGD
jgi:ABC-type phosphate transport system permease subunit